MSEGTNAEGLNIAAAEEATQGESPPPSTGWLNLEADAVGDPGASYKKQARAPFTITRQLRRPFVSGMDATLTLDLDAIKDHIDFFGEAMFKSTWLHSGGKNQSLYRPTAVTATGYTVAAAGDYPDGTLMVARGFGNENDGLKVLASATALEIRTPDLVVQADPPDNVQLEIAGFQFAASDLELDADGNLITTTKDLTTLGIEEHQMLYLASPLEQDAPHCFDTDGYYGFMEVLTVAQNKITLRRRQWEVGAADDGDGKTIRLFFTKWIRNVARSHDDEKLVSHAFEVTYSDLADGPADAYEQLSGYMLDQVTFNIPAEGKVSMQMTFVGKTASDPTTDREDGPADALNVVTSLAVSTSADITRLSVDNVDESGLMTDFQDLKVMLKNNIVGAKAVGHLGNRFTPLGVFQADVEAQVYFTDPAIVTCVRDCRVLRLAVGMRNTDFGMVLDIPSTGAMKADKKIDHNKLIEVSSTISGNMDPISGFTAGMSMFAFLPVLAPGTET